MNEYTQIQIFLLLRIFWVIPWLCPLFSVHSIPFVPFKSNQICVRVRFDVRLPGGTHTHTPLEMNIKS